MRNTYLFGLILILVMLVPLASYSQITGKVDYKVILESHEFKELQGTLYFDDLESYFFVDMKLVESGTDQDNKVKLKEDENIQMEFDLTLKRPTRYEVYIHRAQKNILSQSSIFKDGAVKPCVVLEQTGSVNWEISDEFKKIGSFSVQKATSTFRGRNYTAWFTTEIPIPIGPWKFHGLPGLILEVQDDEMGVQFLFSSIQVPYMRKDEIRQPSDGKIIPLSEYVEYNKNFEDEFMKLFIAKLPREVSISSISVNKVVKSIEREY